MLPLKEGLINVKDNLEKIAFYAIKYESFYVF